MRNKTDKILLSVLWLLAVTLGACFWFKSMYGFNLFLGAHWKYLATLQAGQTAIQSGFYISLVVFTVIALLGLYILVRPKFRRIAVEKRAPESKPAPQRPTTYASQSVSATMATSQPAPAQTIAQTQSKPLDTTPPPALPPHIMPAGLNRPMRPNVARPTSFDAATPPSASPAMAPQASSPAPTTNAAPANYPEIREMFSSAGYVVKNAPPRIDRTPIALLAIGTGEQLWIGGVGIATTDLTRAIDKLNQVFSDTLDDIFINVNGFVVAAPDAATNATNVLTFDGMADLANYIATHPNTPPADDERENFNAYSEYIDTVTEYIGKI